MGAHTYKKCGSKIEIAFKRSGGIQLSSVMVCTQRCSFCVRRYIFPHSYALGSGGRNSEGSCGGILCLHLQQDAARRQCENLRAT